MSLCVRVKSVSFFCLSRRKMSWNGNVSCPSVRGQFGAGFRTISIPWVGRGFATPPAGADGSSQLSMVILPRPWTEMLRATLTSPLDSLSQKSTSCSRFRSSFGPRNFHSKCGPLVGSSGRREEGSPGDICYLAPGASPDYCSVCRHKRIVSDLAGPKKEDLRKGRSCDLVVG